MATIKPTGAPGQAEVTGIGKYPDRPLHQYWIETLKEAAHTAQPQGDSEGWRTVQTHVMLKHDSPGWLDGFRVTIGT